MLTVAEMMAEADRLGSLIDQGIEAMRRHAVALAEAENAYRKAKAEAWLRCPSDPAGTKAGERDWTAARREQWVNAETADLRRIRDLHDSERQAAIEAVRSRRQQLSALQTIANAHREEAGLARQGVAA